MTAQIIPLFPHKHTFASVVHTLAAWRPSPGDRVVVTLPMLGGDPPAEFLGIVLSGPSHGRCQVEIEGWGYEAPVELREMRPVTTGGAA